MSWKQAQRRWRLGQGHTLRQRGPFTCPRLGLHRGECREAHGRKPLSSGSGRKKRRGGGDPRLWSPELVRPGPACQGRYNPGWQVSQEGGNSHRQTQLHLTISMHGTLEAGSESSGAVLPRVGCSEGASGPKPPISHPRCDPLGRQTKIGWELLQTPSLYWSWASTSACERSEKSCRTEPYLTLLNPAFPTTYLARNSTFSVKYVLASGAGLTGPQILCTPIMERWDLPSLWLGHEAHRAWRKQHRSSSLTGLAASPPASQNLEL